ncbi:integrase [Escherichia coli]|nr:integrase [Escherichia coli]
MLTVKQIEAAKPKEKPYRLLDGNGLYLYVPVSGKKVWQLRYKIDGKEKILTVGKYPLMTLQEARDKAWTARKEISVGIDLNRPGFPGECFICELRLPDHRFRWKHNKLFLLLPEEYGPAFPAIVDCYTSPPT